MQMHFQLLKGLSDSSKFYLTFFNLPEIYFVKFILADLFVKACPSKVKNLLL